MTFEASFTTISFSFVVQMSKDDRASTLIGPKDITCATSRVARQSSGGEDVSSEDR